MWKTDSYRTLAGEQTGATGRYEFSYRFGMEGIRSSPECPFRSDDWPMRERNQTLVGREKALFPRSKNEGAETNIFILVPKKLIYLF